MEELYLFLDMGKMMQTCIPSGDRDQYQIALLREIEEIQFVFLSKAECTIWEKKDEFFITKKNGPRENRYSVCFLTLCM